MPSFDLGLSGIIGPIIHMMAWLCLIVVGGFIIFLVVKAITSYRRDTKGKDISDATLANASVVEPETAPGELPADVYIARARELAAAGKYREAVAQLLLGIMSHSERAGLIQFRRGLTLRDYLRAVRPSKGKWESFRSIVRVYEPLGFGRRIATEKHFEASLNDYETGFAQT